MQSERMKNARPSLLLEDDCAPSNARRIGKRPAKALRPSSERRGRISLKRGALALASEVGISEDPFRNLSDEILELILARLSRLPLKAAKKVCKRWASVTSTSEFDILHKEMNPKSRLIRFFISREVSSESECFAYDVKSNAWSTVPGLQLPVLNYFSLDGASGVVFAVAGPGNDRLLYKLTSSASSAESFGEKWYETPVMTFPRVKPLVSVALGAGMGHKVVVAGGGAVRNAQRVGHKAVEVFDSKIGTWESYGDLPKEFSDDVCSYSMSGVVLDNKFYALPLHCKIGELKIHFLDFSTKQLASVQLKSPKGLIRTSIMAIGTTLVVAGVWKGKTKQQFAVKLWKVDLKTPRLIQIGLMPKNLCASMCRHDPLYLMRVSYLVDENLVCVSMYRWLYFVVEVSLEERKTYWRELPYLKNRNPFITKCIPFWASIRPT